MKNRFCFNGLLIFSLCCLPLILRGQTEEKYMEGAVPLVNGQVVFRQEIAAPALSRDLVFETLLSWAGNRFEENSQTRARILLANREAGRIVCAGDEELIFNKSLLSDRSRIHYRLTVECYPGRCVLQMEPVRYIYRVSAQEMPRTYKAEELITDKYSLNRNRGTLLRNTGKFRVKTIDLKDELTASAMAALNKETGPLSARFCGENRKAALGSAGLAAGNVKSGNNSAEDAKDTGIVSTDVRGDHPATLSGNPEVSVKGNRDANNPDSRAPFAGNGSMGEELPGYKRISSDQFPGNIIGLLRDSAVLITAGTPEKFNTMTAGWGALGYVLGKPAAFCFISTGHTACGFIKEEDIFTLSFYTEAENGALPVCGFRSGTDTDQGKAAGLTPVPVPGGGVAFGQARMVIRCRKIGSYPLGSGSFTDPGLKAQRDEELPDEMMIGEITGIWIR